jgi:hypothetical protein
MKKISKTFLQSIVINFDLASSIQAAISIEESPEYDPTEEQAFCPYDKLLSDKEGIGKGGVTGCDLDGNAGEVQAAQIA